MYTERVKIYGPKTMKNISKYKSTGKKNATHQLKIKHKEGSEWVTTELLNLIKERDKLYIYQKNISNTISNQHIETQFKRLIMK